MHNIAIDPLDENYFVSAGFGGEPVISLWDKRGASQSGLSDGFNSGPVLEYKHAFDSYTSATIWGLRFSGHKRGSFAALTNVGNLKVFETASFLRGQELSARPSNPLGGSSWSMRSYTKRTHDIRGPCQDGNPIMAFDYLSNGSLVKEESVIGLNLNREVEVLKVPCAPAPIRLTASDEFLLRPRRKTPLQRAIKRTIADELKLIQKKTLKRLKDGNQISATQKEEIWIARQTRPFDDLTPSSNALEVSTPDERPKTSFKSEKIHWRVRKHDELQNLMWPLVKPKLASALIRLTTHRRRCQEGYGFDCERNKTIVANDPWLVELWDLLARLETFTKNYGMVTETLDLSHLGVWNIWHNALGPHPYRLLRENADTARNFVRSVERICQSKRYPAFGGVKTESPEHRQLCLAICGWTFDEEKLKCSCEDLVKQGHYYKAIFRAVVQGHKDIAIHVLKYLIQRRKIENVGLAAVIACDSVGEDQRELCSWMAEETKDIYLKALLTYFVSGQWHSVVDLEELALVDRISVALQHLNDDKLGQYIKSLTSTAIKEGDIEGVVLTGLAEQSMELFQSYITRTGDLQTAVLATAFTVPRFVNDPVWEIWKETYFSQMQAWRAFMERARFTSQHNKRLGGPHGQGLMRPMQRQVYLYCSKCKKNLLPSAGKQGKASSFPSSPEKKGPPFPGTTLEGLAAPTQFNPLTAGSDSACPWCGEPMPRCSVCMISFKYPKTLRHRDTGGAREGEDDMASFIAFCFNCGHAYHPHHAKQWFSEWAECPEPSCKCMCGLTAYGKD